MSAGTNAGAAAAAAAAQRIREQQEEEEMSQYQGDDLGDWEFKILRSRTGGFRNPDRMRAMLDEEARAGWVLVEKFDDARIRLKRPTSARANDSLLEFDPYRTYAGMSDSKLTLIILGSIGAVVLLIAGVLAGLFAAGVIN